MLMLILIVDWGSTAQSEQKQNRAGTQPIPISGYQEFVDAAIAGLFVDSHCTSLIVIIVIMNKSNLGY